MSRERDRPQYPREFNEFGEEVKWTRSLSKRDRNQSYNYPPFPENGYPRPARLFRDRPASSTRRSRSPSSTYVAPPVQPTRRPSRDSEEPSNAQVHRQRARGDWSTNFQDDDGSDSDSNGDTGAELQVPVADNPAPVPDPLAVRPLANTPHHVPVQTIPGQPLPAALRIQDDMIAFQAHYMHQQEQTAEELQERIEALTAEVDDYRTQLIIERRAGEQKDATIRDLRHQLGRATAALRSFHPAPAPH
ncbi:hypothetical protein CALVIDRAFT_563763 [Calocera viscosa TUFC12733]|uniref:Uncharacterized protein n=1 Tax=Calocera viscosa (strain TUFC12733) TaxID=1330018 RepID=A0A167MGP5_CALVF|nr:hypothetical protein CALVIDRAFT_563763 [Calocera viscosa TUFC12733]